MKKATLLIGVLFVLLLCSIVYAESVMIINVHYKDGVLRITDKAVQPGNYPDRKVQPDNGYNLELLSATGEVLYSFKFTLPIYQFEDSVNPDLTVSGGVTKLSETEFALTLPYLKDADVIKIYNQDQVEVAFAKVITFGEMLAPGIRITAFFSIPILLAAAAVVGFLWWKRLHT
ncbi:MAG: hypothetical protein KJ601_03565 [Nanoarchaeota archaeon]|nr:hypothetical protein [Nanoarchaeota archaeon]